MTITNSLPIIILVLFFIFAWIKTRRTNTQSAEVGVGRLEYVDGLRGIASIAVVATHFWRTTPSGASVSFLFDGRANYGPLGVQIFFCITGLLFFGQMLSKNGNFSWDAFYMSRTKRILPAYISFFCLGIVAVLVYGNISKIESSHFINLLDMAFFGLLGNGGGKVFAGVYIELIFGVIWTLKYEILFYLSFPFIVFATKHIGTAISFAVMFALTVYELIKTGSTFCGYFATGGLAYIVGNKLNPSPAIKYALGILCASAVYYSLSTALPPYGWKQFVLSSLIFISIAICKPGFLSAKPLKHLGDISYSIYLVHAPILIMNGVLFHTLFKKGIGGPLPFAIIAFTGVLAVYIVSAVQYKYIELPWMRKKKPFPLESKQVA